MACQLCWFLSCQWWRRPSWCRLGSKGSTSPSRGRTPRLLSTSLLSFTQVFLNQNITLKIGAKKLSKLMTLLSGTLEVEEVDRRALLELSKMLKVSNKISGLKTLNDNTRPNVAKQIEATAETIEWSGSRPILHLTRVYRTEQVQLLDPRDG